MAYFLRALYVATAVGFTVALVLLMRGRRVVARRFAIVGAACGALAILLYWYLAGVT